MPEGENEIQDPVVTPPAGDTVTGSESIPEPVTLAGDALEPGITINGEIAYRPTDNDGDYENYVNATPYDGYARRVSHDTDNIAFRIYDRDFAPESLRYAVVIDNDYVTEATMVVGDVKRFEVRSYINAPYSDKYEDRVVEGAVALPSKPMVVEEEEEEGDDVPVAPDPSTYIDPACVGDVPSLAWVSTDTTKAIIVESNKVRAIAPGEVVIEIHNTYNNYFAQLTITIEEPTVDNVFTIEV